MVSDFNWFAFQSRKGYRNLITNYDLNQEKSGMI